VEHINILLMTDLLIYMRVDPLFPYKGHKIYGAAFNLEDSEEITELI
jgi:hypothetical protein